MSELILASSSRYRQALLARLGLPFTTAVPDVDESPLADEQPEALAIRLAGAKAEKIAVTQSGALVIGSDQLATFDGRVLGKPGTVAAAIDQLSACSGRDVTFLTSVCLIGPDFRGERLVPTTVQFRNLRTDEIERYIEQDQPLDCAGSFKSEALGISLFKSLSSTDPTALEGLPLIAVCELLREAGLEIPA